MEHDQQKVHKIFSIQTDISSSGLVEIETMILKGLYRFSILGIHQKYSSEIKDRVYSALRAHKILNLKSDNRKITVNLLPTAVEKKSSVYDLGIALGCLTCLNEINLDEDIFVVGELSIVGNVIQSNSILSTIHQAVKNKIKLIICGSGDIDILIKNQNLFFHVLLEYKIRFIVSDNLGDLIVKIKQRDYFYIDSHKSGNFSPVHKIPVHIDDINEIKLILALCTKRSVFIENKKNGFITKFIKNLSYYAESVGAEKLIRLADELKVGDEVIMKNYQIPFISNIDSLTKKEDVGHMMKESLYGFNVIENIEKIGEDTLQTVIKNKVSSVVCFYNSCPCGNNNAFFDQYDGDKCFCLQRNILKYRQRIKRLENGFFDFLIKDQSTQKSPHTPDIYIRINKIIQTFDDFSTELTLDNDIPLSELDNYDKDETTKIIKTAGDIARLNLLLSGSKVGKQKITREDVSQAILFLKKDF